MMAMFKPICPFEMLITISVIRMCLNDQIRNQKARIVTTRGDLYVGNDVDAARQQFKKLKDELESSVDGSQGLSYVLMVDGDVEDAF
jgi:hypothetical protein